MESERGSRIRRIRSRPGLVGRFALGSLVAFLAVGSTLAWVITHQIVQREIQNGQARANSVAQSILGYELTPQDLLAPASGARLQELSELARSRILRWPVVRVKIWRSDGMLLFSDDAALIGNRYPLERELGQAFATGRPVSAITDLQKGENVDERALATKLLESYIPLRLQPRTAEAPVAQAAPVAVVELYQDYTSVQEQVNRTRGTILVTLLTGLLLLYLFLLPIMRRASKTLTRQNAALDRHATHLGTLLERERDATAERRTLLERTLRAGEEERTRLAAELHDGPVHRLAALGLSLDGVTVRLQRGDLEGSRHLLERVEDKLSEAVRELRGIMRQLRPPALDERGLESAIRDYVDILRRDFRLECAVDARLDTRLGPAAEIVLYRVAQESLLNVVKHAQGAHASLTLRTENGSVALEVRDDGTGFEPDPSTKLARDGHFGLLTMRERVEMSGGTWELWSHPGEGTRLRAVVPIGEPR